MSRELVTSAPRQTGSALAVFPVATARVAKRASISLLPQEIAQGNAKDPFRNRQGRRTDVVQVIVDEAPTQGLCLLQDRLQTCIGHFDGFRRLKRPLVVDVLIASVGKTLES